MNDDKELIGKTIVCAEIGGFGLRLKFSDGSILDYSSSSGGYSCWEITDDTKQAERDGETEPTIDPVKRGNWIPCSERLPEDKKAVYWACDNNGYQFQCRWTNVNHFWTNLTTEWHWNLFDVPQYSEVVAWMPLPEPYKEEQDEID